MRIFLPQVQLDLSINYEGMPETPPPSEHADEDVEGPEADQTEATAAATAADSQDVIDDAKTESPQKGTQSTNTNLQG